MRLPEGCDVLQVLGKGRAVVTTRPLRAGDVAFSCAPYRAVLYDDQIATCCSSALEPRPDGTLACSRCKMMRYESREAQKKDWKRGHKQECAALVACRPRVPSATIRLAARVLWARQDEKARETDSSTDAASFGDVDSLLSHWESLTPNTKVTLAQMAVVTQSFMRGGDAGATPEGSKEVAMLLARFACNNHTVCDPELRPLGVGIFPFAALLNHSCRPNCMQSFARGVMVLRAVEDVPSGAELSISYIELAAPTLERRQELLDNFHFDAYPLVRLTPTLHAARANAPPLNRAPSTESAAIGGHLCATRCSADLCIDARDQRLCRVSIGSRPSYFVDPAVDGALQRALPSRDSAAESTPSDPREGRIFCWGRLAVREAEDDGGLEGRAAWATSAAADDASRWDEDLLLTLGHQGSNGESHAEARCTVSKPALERLLKQGQGGVCAQGWDALCACDGWRADVWCWGEGIAEDGTWKRLCHDVAYVMACSRWCKHAIGRGWCTLAQELARHALTCAANAGLDTGHVFVTRLLEMLMKLCIEDATSFAEAFACARLLLPTYRAVYPPVWPNLGLHLAMLARLANYLELDHETMAFGNDALTILQCTHAQGDVLRSLGQALQECGAAMSMRR